MMEPDVIMTDLERHLEITVVAQKMMCQHMAAVNNTNLILEMIRNGLENKAANKITPGQIYDVEHCAEFWIALALKKKKKTE